MVGRVGASMETASAQAAAGLLPMLLSVSVPPSVRGASRQASLQACLARQQIAACLGAKAAERVLQDAGLLPTLLSVSISPLVGARPLSSGIRARVPCARKSRHVLAQRSLSVPRDAGVHASSTLSDRAHVKMARQQTLPLPVWILWCGLLGES